MGRSNALRLTDIRTVFRLVGDCRDLRRDRGDWNKRAIEGLQQISGSVLVTSCTHNSLSEPFVQFQNSWFTPWPCQRSERTWIELLQAGRHQSYSTVQEVYTEPGVAKLITPREMMSTREWQASDEYADRRELGQDDTVISTTWNTNGRLHFFSVNRAANERHYSVRERAMIRLFHDELALLFDSVLNLSATGPLEALPPRLRQVLKALAEGESEKQIAKELGISRTTVHGYISELYQRFGVHSRSELLAWYYKQ
jgi:DNA-binding CsgD family transcriptional regulator